MLMCIQSLVKFCPLVLKILSGNENYDGFTELQINRQGKSSIAPTFSKRGYKKIRGMTDFSDQFRKIMCYKHIGYNLNVMGQSACLVINPITVDGFAALFNCTPVDRASD